MIWRIRAALLGACLMASSGIIAHDEFGRTHAPAKARSIKSPLPGSTEHLAAGQRLFETHCAHCHGTDGRGNGPGAADLRDPPVNLVAYTMDLMSEGEAWWVISNGIPPYMPPFKRYMDVTEQWQVVQWIRELRSRKRAQERERLGSFDWKLPPGFPFPDVPEDNRMTAEKVELGRHLFYDPRLSINNTQSCGSCHQQKLAFTDGKPRGVGATGEEHVRGAQSLINIGYAPVLTWANPNIRRLEQQALVPMFGDRPVELGMGGREQELIARLSSEPRYPRMFTGAFPESSPAITIENITKAIAAFQRSIISGSSAYDRFRAGDERALSKAARRGEALFFSEKFECFHCHGGFNFTGTVNYLDKGFAEVEFHNNGLYAAYPAHNPGVAEFTQEPSDEGKFKAPSLRNIEVTAPYMHDGSLKTLEDVIDHYSTGGQNHANRSEFVKPVRMGRRERKDLIEFLRSLTDKAVLTDPRYSDPWGAASSRSAAGPSR